MQNQDSPINAASKLLSFPRSIPVSMPGLPLQGAPQGLPLTGLPPMEARLSRPTAAGKAISLPKLSPAAALAHDARNALTSLELLSGLLAEPGVLHLDHAHFAADLHSVTHALTGLIGRFAELASDIPASVTQASQVELHRASAVQATQPLEKQAETAGEAVESCTRLLRNIAGSKIAVHVSADKGLPRLAIGDDALLRVLMNLVKNASEAMPKGGEVYITAQQALGGAAPAVLVHVADNGPGISPFAVKRIFEPGFSSKHADLPGSARKACGLGLAIVRELVEAAGGEVQVASTRGRGTIFELRLPAYEPAS